MVLGTSNFIPKQDMVKNEMADKEYCGKIAYANKKQAKKSAHHFSLTKFGGPGSKFSIYHCKVCLEWHIYTENKDKVRSNKEHSRGGRRRRRPHRKGR